MTNPILCTRTDDNGVFRFLSEADDETQFYVMARDHALAVTALRSSDENVIRLEPLAHEGTLRVLTRDGAPIAHSARLRVAPSGGTIVPPHVLGDLARMLDRTWDDIVRTDVNGHSALPRYLGRGTWDVYVRGERSVDVQRLGSVTAPLRVTRGLTAIP